ncbi:hypothetical protein COF09_18310 [Bacillus toyonensis]|nr:hypothetical protein COF09_18310 [Bacillus toyonensis]
MSSLLQSRQGKNRSIGRSMVYKILSGAAEKFGLDEIGTHTLRKTYGYHMYMQILPHGNIQSFVREGHVTLYGYKPRCDGKNND